MPSSQRKSLQPGHVLLSRYRVVDMIWAGGGGAVYLARDLQFTNIGRMCAIKEMINTTPDQNTREILIHTFEREAGLLATLNHSAIPQVFDFFSVGRSSYLVMELVQGVDLESILNSTDQFLPVETVRQWAIEVCDVLSYLHSHEPEPVVFRDLKPNHLMIDQHKQVRLIDFGIARAFHTGQPGTVMGTEGYSPPEQYKGVATPATDIYALGATLHHLLTRADPRQRAPFSFEEHPIRNYNPAAPAELAAVVMRALAYSPERRYLDASAFRECLAKANIDGS